MSGLLAFYQKQRLLREKQNLELKLARQTSTVDRVHDNITKTQKRYESMLTLIGKQAETLKAQASVFFQQQSGIGVGQVSPYDMSGMTAFIQARTAELCKTGAPKLDDSGKETGTVIKIDDNAKIRTLMQEYVTNGHPLPKLDSNNKAIENEFKSCTTDEAALFMNAINQARQEQVYRQQQVQTLNTQYANNISVWVEAQEAAIKAEQEQAIKPLEYEETMMKLDKAAIEQRLAEVKEQYDSYSKLCETEAKENAPKFGL